jgi:hypothetical protein
MTEFLERKGLRYGYATSHYWYRPEAFKGRTFLLFTEAEFAAANEQSLQIYPGTPVKTEIFEGYRVLIYDFNIAERYPSWDTPFSVDENYALDDLKAEVIDETGPLSEKAGEGRILKVQVRNLGSRGFGSEGTHPILIGAHLYTDELSLKDYYYSLTGVQGEMMPGKTVEQRIFLKPLPPAKYVLEVELVQGGVTWFGKTKDGRTLRTRLLVE